MESLHYLLMKTHSLFSRRVLSEVSKIGLTRGQPKVLDYLLQCGEADQKTIAAYCEIEPATVGSILLRMERDGLVRRVQKDGNRRALYVSLTEKGRQTALQVQQIFQQADARAAATLTTEESLRLQQLLQRVYDAVAEPERKSF